MKRPSVYHSDRPTSEARMTPMIDVIFLLLIFFLATAGFRVPESVLSTKLPDVPSAPTEPAERTADRTKDFAEVLRIELGRGEQATVAIRLNDRPLSGIDELIGLLDRLAQVSTESPVILDISPDTLLGTVVEVYDACLAVGFRRVRFAARQEPRE